MDLRHLPEESEEYLRKVIQRLNQE